MKKRPHLRVDFHVHTDHSKDSRASPRAVVQRALELGLDAIAVTDHNTVSGALEAEKAAGKTSLLVIPGQEVRCQEGEVIVLGLRETLPNKMPAGDLVREAQKKKGFVIVPHPFDLMRKGVGRSMQDFVQHIDAIEVFNARTIFNSFNNKALSFADKHGLPMTVGSDTHFPEEMGGSYMLVHSRKETGPILEAVRAGRTELVVNRTGLAKGLRRGLLKLRTYA